MPKKKTALTIEERLQQALVPAEEQPYEVPENWVWVRLGAVCFFENGYAFKSDKFSSEKGIPVIRISNIKENNVDLDDCIKTLEENIDEKYIVHQGDLLIAMSGATTGKNGVYMSANIAYLNQRVGNIKVKNKELLIEKFRNFYIANMQNEILNTAYGGAQPNISSQKMSVMTFPLPPLSEQQRIVERIEELFAKLDEAKERLQEVAESFAVRKAAILHKAFTGELTQQWRRENGVSDESWEEKKLGEVGSWLGGGTPSTSREEYWENGNILWITSKDMKSAVIEDTLMKVNEIGVKNSSANYIEKPALLVVMRSGILRRTFPVAMVKKPFTVNQDLKAIIPDKDDLEFLYWMLLSNEQRILDTCMKNGTTVESINSNALKNLTFKCPTLSEQHEIVRLIDDLLARERKAQQATEQALASIDLMKKSILARAFRGELGTNKASEASALELLR
ncbi:restriction endonuclease subunit S [Phascolarctobacterium succinatutens]|uniref:restriction endonuclease subunit S n=1 Tax=Phascolarctobacterium succinatutens TaxID=626940 RepID=UPI0026EEDD3F|nr:restriction endonuclease subunit S [Phascolarctobacterium succinatutens]MBS5426805.1 restriction endonuclease subunit S [Phascolarctobacterium succinatutens]